MSSSYLEHFLETLETLPTDLQRNFTLMRDLDSRTQDFIKKINADSSEYLNNVSQLNSNTKTERIKSIHEMFNKAKDLSDDKVQLSMQTYEMVDKHIRRLDAELTKLEADLKDKSLNNTMKTPVEEKKKGRNVASTASGKNSLNTGRGEKKAGFNPKQIIKEENDKSKKKQKITQIVETTIPTVNTLISTGNEILDMPVDPNEPTYCICHQVSYGEMIGCDNPDCPIEWFHFGCVGLTTKPKGKWFCQKCSVERKKK